MEEKKDYSLLLFVWKLGIIFFLCVWLFLSFSYFVSHIVSFSFFAHSTPLLAALTSPPRPILSFLSTFFFFPAEKAHARAKLCTPPVLSQQFSITALGSFSWRTPPSFSVRVSSRRGTFFRPFPRIFPAHSLLLPPLPRWC